MRSEKRIKKEPGKSWHQRFFEVKDLGKDPPMVKGMLKKREAEEVPVEFDPKQKTR